MADENENVEGIKFKPASYMCDDYRKDGFVRVVVWIQGMETSAELTFEGLLPKIVRKPINAEIEVIFEERSFCMTMIGKSGDLKWINKRLKIKKLLHEIIPEESYYEVDKRERIIMFLKKKEDISWMPEMDRGLQCMEEEEKNKEEKQKQLRETEDDGECECEGEENEGNEEECEDGVEGIHLGSKTEGDESEEEEEEEEDKNNGQEVEKEEAEKKEVDETEQCEKEECDDVEEVQKEDEIEDEHGKEEEENEDTVDNTD